MYRIFIVEDDPVIASQLLRHIQSWGLEAAYAQDFQHVLEEFRQFQPHLVLMDISLPFFNGYHWCQEIRRESKVPVVFLSSMSDNMNIVMAMNMGGDDFIAKPFDLNVLTAKLQAVLRPLLRLRPPRCPRWSSGAPGSAPPTRCWNTRASGWS